MPNAEKRNPTDVKEMFGNVSKNYDKINRAMCFGLDTLWRKTLAKTALKECFGSSPIIADLACGSGDVAIELAKTDSSAQILASDFCPEMIEIARKKSNKENLSERIKFIQADCENLPFEDNKFNAITISFGFRNFQNRQKCLVEIYRILAPKGRLAILEVSRAGTIMEFAQKIFMSLIVPTIAVIFGGRRDDYKYLANTTMSYPYPAQVEKMFAYAGFENIKTRKFGCGLVAITTGTKKDAQ